MLAGSGTKSHLIHRNRDISTDEEIPVLLTENVHTRSHQKGRDVWIKFLFTYTVWDASAWNCRCMCMIRQKHISPAHIVQIVYIYRHIHINIQNEYACSDGWSNLDVQSKKGIKMNYQRREVQYFLFDLNGTRNKLLLSYKCCESGKVSKHNRRIIFKNIPTYVDISILVKAYRYVFTSLWQHTYISAQKRFESMLYWHFLRTLIFENCFTWMYNYIWFK